MRAKVFLIAVLSLVFASSAMHVSADPPWKRGKPKYKHKKRNKKHGHGYGYKEEYRDGNCKYEYKEGPHGYKEEVKCWRPRWVKGGPPPWAPAHGYRRKKRRRYEVRREEVYVVPFGIALGRCNQQEIGAILGGVAGGVIGSRIGKGDGRTAATIGGALIGILVGGAIGRDLDAIDQACTGQVLEHARTNQVVEWRNLDSGTRYKVKPTNTYQTSSGEYCREYYSEAIIDGVPRRAHGTACRRPDGTWKLMN